MEELRAGSSRFLIRQLETPQFILVSLLPNPVVWQSEKGNSSSFPLERSETVSRDVLVLSSNQTTTPSISGNSNSRNSAAAEHLLCRLSSTLQSENLCRSLAIAPWFRAANSDYELSTTATELSWKPLVTLAEQQANQSSLEVIQDQLTRRGGEVAGKHEEEE